tara:strand:- start:140 stop:712 length:573 start_codon:yes stop_codon:yes gene_type:complete
MGKERRLITIATLTLVIFAVSIYLRQSAFVFPIPLNPFIVLIVALQFAWWNKNQPFPALLLIFIGACSLLGTEVFWSFFISDETMLQFSETTTTDTFSLAALIGLLVLSISGAIRQKHILTWSLSILFIVLTVLSNLFYDPLNNLGVIFSLTAMASASVSVIYKPVYQPLHLFWVLLFILECTKFISIIS